MPRMGRKRSLFSFRKSIKLPGGFRVNMTQNGVGWSWGVGGVRVGHRVNSGGNKTSSPPTQIPSNAPPAYAANGPRQDVCAHCGNYAGEDPCQPVYPWGWMHTTCAQPWIKPKSSNPTLTCLVIVACIFWVLIIGGLVIARMTVQSAPDSTQDISPADAGEDSEPPDGAVSSSKKPERSMPKKQPRSKPLASAEVPTIADSASVLPSPSVNTPKPPPTQPTSPKDPGLANPNPPPPPPPKK